MTAAFKGVYSGKMSKLKELTELQIASKIKAGIDFTVKTNRERKKALSAAKYLGSDIVTRALADGFQVIIASEVED